MSAPDDTTPKPRKLSENQLWMVRTVAQHATATVRGGLGWHWGESPSKVRVRLEKLEALGLLERITETTWGPTDEARIALAIEQAGRAMKRFVADAAWKRQAEKMTADRDAALRERCAKWLEPKYQLGVDPFHITADDLAAFVMSCIRGDQ